jgi:hypothetical protein
VRKLSKKLLLIAATEAVDDTVSEQMPILASASKSEKPTKSEKHKTKKSIQKPQERKKSQERKKPKIIIIDSDEEN